MLPPDCDPEGREGGRSPPPPQLHVPGGGAGQFREACKPLKKRAKDEKLSLREKSNRMNIARLTKSASAPSFVRPRPYRSRVWQTTPSKNNAKKLPL